MWDGRICEKRQKEAKSSSEKNFRTELERDYDRILFSTPVRRLADKTQVFPLEKNDSVRTRLTHSHEVSCIARSIGNWLVYHSGRKDLFDESGKRNIPTILASVGLAHDLGNPPFGHKGEDAIRSWFKRNQSKIFENEPDLTEAHKNDFLKFEGNAQTIRLLSKLQLLNDNRGLDLTYETIASLMKYTVPSDKTDKAFVAKKKVGFFQSEKFIVEKVFANTVVKEGKRHPLAYIMEACDDIAYVVADTEDAVKKNITSFTDVINFLRMHDSEDPVIEEICNKSEEKWKEYRKKKYSLTPAELNDVCMQRFRVFAMTACIEKVQKYIEENFEAFLTGEIDRPLVEKSEAKKVHEGLFEFDKKHAYRHVSVRRNELHGYNVLTEIMDSLWEAITDRVDTSDPKSPRKSVFSQFLYDRISENYKRIYEENSDGLPLRYRDAQLLTDMISGMTDGFAIEFHKEIKSLKSSSKDSFN